MVVAEFLLIAFVVGIVTKTWIGFVGTFAGLYMLYRFTRLAAVLALVLSLYWGLLGYHLGVATGGLPAGVLLGAAGFVVGLGIHRSGYLVGGLASRPVSTGHPSHDESTEQCAPIEQPRAVDDAPRGPIIDVEYRIVS
ncbi:MAG: hypothetical protein DCC71_14915 [Proteobacteria bacterium]|nr:MAG: hypothetical protein DCC71_14915 [Pseudomonadota bacterium]